MPGLNQSSSNTQLDNNNRSKTKVGFASERTEIESNLAELLDTPLDIQTKDGDQSILTTVVQKMNRRGSFENQTAWPGDARLGTSQRQALAAEIGRVQGNRHLQRVIGSSKQPSKRERMAATAKQPVMQKQETTPQPQTPLLPEIWNCLPPWMKKRVKRQPALREALLILYARIGNSLWNYIPEGSITSIGLMGVMEFKLQDDSALKKALKDRGYTDAYFAKASKNFWGLRESNVDAAGLHWRGLPGNKVNVHIDLHPPSWIGFWHWFMDSFLPYTLGVKPTLADVQSEVESLGIEIPVIQQQKVHSKLTARFNVLESRAEEEQSLAAQAEIEEGRGYLQQAASILWNNDVLSQATMENALFYLAWARTCASGAEHQIKIDERRKTTESTE